ncbi:metallophosphoesterase family protein [Miltoncostaea marina]|uniref:metallophosphoesterase family protein n=1 Tax=Miltoncostaea marina TaxID=2843215 RepID=UPI002484AF7D|nr:metallophosphoesterase family protein [Miltoncostaea marina]
MRIGVVADTHVPDLLRALPDEVCDALAGADLILHAGDVTAPAVLDRLRAIAPVAAVRGNHDRGRQGRALPRDLVVRAGGLRIGLTHGHRPAPAELAAGVGSLVAGRPPLGSFARAARRRFGDVDVVVVGHLHVRVHEVVEGALVFSPGAVYVAEHDPAFDWSTPKGRLYRRHRSGLPAEAIVPAVGVIEPGPAGPVARTIPLRRPRG